MRGWVRDVVLGVRLALGGGRMSRVGVVRLVMSTIGIGLATAVLLTAAAIPNASESYQHRQYAQFDESREIAGVDPLLMAYGGTEFRGERISGYYLQATGSTSPRPPGVDHNPGPGEMVVSPALNELLNSPDGALLAPRFPGRHVVGVIAKDGVVDPHEMNFYAGATLDHDAIGVSEAYAFGWMPAPIGMPMALLALILVGVVAILTPVLIFVVTSSRIAGAERDRRLAALRLVGASRRQVIRMSAAESLLSATTGLIVGTGLFLLLRANADHFELAGSGYYPSDLTPSWPLALLVVLLVPGLAVMASLFALRRTIIEPLGVVRFSKPIRRRLVWRIVPFVLGAGLLTFHGPTESDRAAISITAGAALLLIGIPILLPALLERSVSRFNGGKPALQLAVGRLKLDSGTPARVVGGVAVVLAGAIAMQTIMSAEADRLGFGNYSPDEGSTWVEVTDDVSGDAVTALRGVPGVQHADLTRSLSAKGTGESDHYGIVVGDCAVLQRTLGVKDCADGDVFASTSPSASGQQAVRAGSTLKIMDYTRVQHEADEPTSTDWTVPATLRPIDLPLDDNGLSRSVGDVIATPGAMPPGELGYRGTVTLKLMGSSPDVLDLVRNALGPFEWRASVYTTNSHHSEAQQAFGAIRNGLLGGSLFTLLLAAVSLLVVALEQVRERRRPIAAMAASGVPTSTLARSLLWQNVIPVVLAVAVAVVTGLGLAASIFSLLDEPFQVDWLTVGLLCAASAVAVLLVTSLTLPSLRTATRLESLRTE